LDEVLASVTGQGGDPNLGNWTLGQITADAMREAAGADMALVNSGVFPQSPRPGPLTREGLYEVFPSDDEVVTLEVPGSLVQRVLQRSRGQAGSGAFLQVSGLRVDPADGPLSVTVGGEALQGRRKYKLAVTGFLAEGGEGYGDLPKVRSKTPSARSVRELLEKGLRARRTVEMGNPEKRWNFPPAE
jgi:2',3'-cyclic-nucleotide 2'-phosphodiesterase (5'-nucleotidase family)